MTTISAGTTSTTAYVATPDTTGTLVLKTGSGVGTTALTIDASQNVGIGTSSPARPLSITSNSAETQLLLRENDASGPQLLIGADSAVSGSIINASSVSGSNNNLLFQTGGTERARIDSSGNLLVGTTIVNPAASRVSGINLLSSGQVYSRAASQSYFALSTSSGSNIAFFTDNGSALISAGTISSNGTTTSYNATSDYRLKNEVQNITNALERVAKLRPVTWTWKEGFGGTQPNCEGFIAHELQEVIPVAVTGEKDGVETYTDDEGNEQTRPKYQGIDTSFLVATLTAAIQEQQQMIETLQAKVTALENA